jgi:hypothetical protein
MGRRKNNLANGRNRTTRFARLDHGLLKSPAYRALSCTARALLVELVMLFNGENNGALYLSVRDAAARLGLSDLEAACKAFAELEAMGFVVCTADAHFRVKAAEHSRARCWRLTFEFVRRKPPTFEFREREPAAKTKGRKRMERGLRALKVYAQAQSAGKLPVLENRTIEPMPAEMPVEAVRVSRTPNGHNGGKLPNSFVRVSCTHIANHGYRGDAIVGWWQPEWSKPLQALAYASALAHGSTLANDRWAA